MDKREGFGWIARALLSIAVTTIWASVADAAVGVTYVKTLGQANPSGAPLCLPLRQLVVDPEGNLYYGVGGFPSYSLTKVMPAGNVVWERPLFGRDSRVALTLADGCLYAVCNFELRRFSLNAGEQDPEWGGRLPTLKDAPPGVLGLSSVIAMQAAGSYLFLLDSEGRELRRFDRATLSEKPFATRVMVVDPLDLALSKDGNLLILTPESLLELDVNGKPLRIPLIAGLKGAQALEVDPRDGSLYVAQGGVPGARINQIWQYNANGSPTGTKIGRGGDHHGPYSPDMLAFASGRADFALDPEGGLWGHNGLGHLVHFAAAPSFRLDRALLSIEAGGRLAADAELNIYTTFGLGTMKLSWDNEIVWTCGVDRADDRERFPSTHVVGWPVHIVFAGGQDPLISMMFQGKTYALSANTGEVKAAFPGAGRIFGSGNAVYMAFGEKEQSEVVGGTHETLADWKKWKPFFKLGEGLKAHLLGVSPDKTRLYWHTGEAVFCCDPTGKELWRHPSGHVAAFWGPFAMVDDRVVFVVDKSRKLVALNAKTGTLETVIGAQDGEGRPAVFPSAVAVANKDSRHYLFVPSHRQIQVFEVIGLGGAE